MHRSHPAPTDEVLILGAGPARWPALFAARRGLRVSVIGRGTAVGGLTRSKTIGQVRVDLGRHRLPAARPVLGTLTELLGDDLQLRPRNGWVRCRRWVGFPLHAGRAGPARIPVRWLLAAARRPCAILSWASLDRRTKLRCILAGPHCLQIDLRPTYTRKLWGLPEINRR